MNNLIWGYMLKLSHHMWDDETSPPKGWYLPKPYTEGNETDIEVWDETVKYIASLGYNLVLVDVGDGLLYESHPEISAPDAWSKDLLKKKLDEMRALGLEPIPKLNFSTGHDTWLKEYRRMISTSTYYRVASDLIGEVCEVFGSPRFFHLGFDEESPAYQLTHDMVIVRNGDLWWHDLYFLADECEKRGARPWIWSDYCWQHRDLFLQKMPKSILQSNWYYYIFDDKLSDFNRTCVETYELLDKHGFDQIPTCSTWSNIYNSRQTIAHGKEKLSAEHLKGFMTAAWMFTTRENSMQLLADAQRFYFGRKEFYPESL